MESYFEVGEKLKTILPEDVSIALGSVGIIPYITGLKTYDILGITDAHIAHRRKDFHSTFPGHGKTDGAYILRQRPTVLLLGNVDITARPRRGKNLIPSRGPETDITMQQDFLLLYEMKSIKLEDDRYLNYFRLREER